MIWLSRIKALWLLGWILVRPAVAEPFLPSDDGQILEQLPGGIAAQQARELRRVRARQDQGANDLPEAMRMAREYLLQSRHESDPRFLGYAQAVLAPWWDELTAPAELLILRGIIRQSRHDFSGALVDLETAIKAQPANAQAWLTRATVLQVGGRYDEARRCMPPLMRLAPGLLSTTSAASLASLTGQAGAAYDLLQQTLAHDKQSPTDARQWAFSVLAEIADRLGRSLEAESAYRTAISLDPRDIYGLGAMADFLLDENRFLEVVELLKDYTRVDGLLLRLALAETNEPQAQSLAKEHIALLRARFDASEMRGEKLHLREQARFSLKLLCQPKQALAQALPNWQVQREPADLRILLESAIAAGDASALEIVRAWLEQTHFENARLAPLESKLYHKP